MAWTATDFEPTLSARERQILELVANGLSAKAVAVQIGIRPRTVDRHIENIRLKMRAKNRAHMVTQAVVAGELHLASGDSPDDRQLLLLDESVSKTRAESRASSAGGEREVSTKAR